MRRHGERENRELAKTSLSNSSIDVARFIVASPFMSFAAAVRPFLFDSERVRV